LAWARLESKRIIAEAREDAIKSVLEDFFELLQKARKDKEYKRFMSTAIAQAATELGQTVTIHVLEGEKSLVPSVKGAKVVDDLEALGGAIVESSDGKVMIDLTLETLFETRRDEIRKQVYEKLFGDK
jgi:vacuolar-type H+-ATPase subunit E/Vma4